MEIPKINKEMQQLYYKSDDESGNDNENEKSNKK
jgi:hypothetical protein